MYIYMDMYMYTYDAALSKDSALMLAHRGARADVVCARASCILQLVALRAAASLLRLSGAPTVFASAPCAPPLLQPLLLLLPSPVCALLSPFTPCILLLKVSSLNCSKSYRRGHRLLTISRRGQARSLRSSYARVCPRIKLVLPRKSGGRVRG